MTENTSTLPKLSKRFSGGFTGVLLLSVVAHVAVTVVFLFAERGRAKQLPPEHVMVTKLVRLGKKAPKKLLPRLAPPPPPVLAPPPAVVIPPAPPAPKPPPKAAKPQPKVIAKKKVQRSRSKKKAPKKAAARRVSARERLSQMQGVSSALDRLRHSVADAKPDAAPPETSGDPEGVAGGTQTDLAQAMIGHRYGSAVSAAVKRFYTIEGVDRRLVRGKRATTWMRITGVGEITEYRLEESSGVEAFDRSVLKAIKRCGSVPKPPDEIRERVFEDGMIQ